jgi:hypothetical protein
MRLRTAGLLVLAAFMAPAQELPSVDAMIQAKNWFFDRAVHPETHLIYSRVNLEDPDLWQRLSSYPRTRFGAN